LSTQAIFFDGGCFDKNFQSDDIDMMAKALSGDIIWTVTPATTTRKATSAAWTRNVTVQLTDSAGNVHRWFNKAITTGVSVADTSTAGTASITSTTLTLVNGEATITVSGSAAAWLAAETNTLTVAAATVLGVTCAAKTSVETITA
jgi:tetrahydromethanopterin S-methyltransferase subunit E